MKITREEFKEYVELYKEAWVQFNKYADIINENLLDELLFPALNWFGDKIGIKEDISNLNILVELTDDIDEYYDNYVSQEVK
jgi:hypothetical protein